MRFFFYLKMQKSFVWGVGLGDRKYSLSRIKIIMPMESRCKPHMPLYSPNGFQDLSSAFLMNLYSCSSSRIRHQVDGSTA